ncbi:glycosyltransferase family 2 protein [Sporocytophaga myxococcoides]|uniref:glycosyltransferase family 2 protein n=1 Tax=Sporocytophaga myxococcoides TaxID=153721 RepID=UPI00042309DC|nr:glycosyltransferase family 2 protein [Sporocytophaga myxococcoides]
MKVILPMAGRGSRFNGSGYNVPKPFIPVEGKPMFAWAMQSIEGIDCSELIVIALREHEEIYKLTELISEFAPAKTSLVLINDVTEGQLCTVLAARDLINNDEDILIISSDTIVISEIGKEIGRKREGCKGIISVADMPGDRWSFARLNKDGFVDLVAEKERISDHASTGIYYFSSGKEFVEMAEEIVNNKEKTKGEYYVIPLYQKLINNGYKVMISEASEMWDLGTPESLNTFLKTKGDRAGGG